MKGNKNKNNNKDKENDIKKEKEAEDLNTPEPGEAAAESVQPPEPETGPAEDELRAEKDKYLRLAAEYDNFRKRSVKERENIYADVRADTITKLLPVYDNLLRALTQETADEAYKKGVEMTLSGFVEILEKLGVTIIPALGEIFDPELHSAVMHEELEGKGAGEIVEEFQKGFKLGDRVIRFSLVKVAN